MSDNHSITPNAISTNSNNEGISASQNIQSEALEKCRTKHARPSLQKPPWLNNSSPNTFKKVIVVKEHPFSYKENLAYLVSSESCYHTEILEALVKRNFMNVKELEARELKTG